LKIAEKHKLPLIADEIYEAMVFPGIDFHSFSALSTNVPILSCSGLSKRFLTPGIRQGWIIVHDRNDTLSEVKQGLRNVSARILGSNSTVQYAIPEILQNTPKTFYINTMMKIAVSIESYYQGKKLNFISRQMLNLLTAY
jgi:tyrosine aminotransferase